MTDAVLISAVRTAIGTAFKGTLREVRAENLALPVVTEAIARSGIPAAYFDDVVLAESLYGGGVLARYTAVEAGLASIPGLALNRHCAGGLSAVSTAAAAIKAGFDQAIVAGGVQSSSTAPALGQRRSPDIEWLSQSHRPTKDAPADDMSITVGWNAAKLAGLTRKEMDAWALRSHRRARAAIEAGQFDDEIVPIKVPGADGVPVDFAVDEHPRASTSAEKLAGLRVLHPEIQDFSITAGNASGINDGAAALTVASADLAASLGLTPLARIVGWASVGVEPARTGTAAIAAIRKVARCTSISLADVDLWEINEAFASVPLAAVRELGLDEDKVNPWGSGCSLGHPVAASGARMLTTLAHELHRRGQGLAVAAMCAGGGMAAAVVIEAI